MPSAQIAATETLFTPQTLEDFMGRKFPPKEALIEGVLFKRDLISLIGRRRHGKTTLVGNIALAGADRLQGDYLGFSIPKPFTTVAFLLEDDAAELQTKLRTMQQGRDVDPSRFHLYTRHDLRERKIPKNVKDQCFCNFVHAACGTANPDLVILDNLGMLIGGAYMKPEEINALIELAIGLTERHDCAVLISAHPKKMGDEIFSLAQSPERFFEQAMGSSHFINSTGSMWGIERDANKERATLLLGSQRVTGTHQFTMVEKNDMDWFERIDDIILAAEAALNTDMRRKAFNTLPVGTFTYTQAMEAVRSVGVMKSKGSFNPWWGELRRLGLVKSEGNDGYRKVELPTRS
jgi:RecA-family ATPase